MIKIYPKKYSNLVEISNKVLIPEFIFIDSNINLNEINLFFKKSKSKYFIIRSAINAEDSNLNSYAGHFFTSKKFEKSQFDKIYKNTYLENKKLIKKYNLNSKVTLILQEYIEHKIGGVLFYPWKYYENHFLLDLSMAGAEGGVEGLNSQDFLLSIDEQFCKFELNNYNKSKLKKEDFDNIKKQLITIIKEIKKIIFYKFDLEWCYANKKVYVLQIRPITFMPNAILPETNEIITENLNNINSIENYVYNDFSESFGFLSPFSYSFLIFLYEQSLPYFQKLGFKAKEINFMKRLTNGQILINQTLYDEFFSNSSKLSSFKRGFNSKILHKEIIDFLSNLKINDEISIKEITKIFSYWQISIICNGIFEKNKFTKNTIFFDEYELTNFLDIKISSSFYNKIKQNNLWSNLNTILKEIFLFELDKFKLYLQKINGFSFIDCKYIINTKNLNLKNIEIKKLSKQIKENYIKDITNGVYDLTFFYKNNNSNSTNLQINKNIEGKVFLISNPNLFKGKIPANSILIAPYFNNQLISQINKFKAIILENGGLLSHSAIVAREKNIPYFINQKNILNKFKTGDNMKYSFKTKEFIKN